MTSELMFKWIAKLLSAILPMITPAIKKELEGFVIELHEKALKTENPVDDYLTTFLMNILGVK